ELDGENGRGRDQSQSRQGVRRAGLDAEPSVMLGEVIGRDLSRRQQRQLQQVGPPAERHGQTGRHARKGGGHRGVTSTSSSAESTVNTAISVAPMTRFSP